MRRLSVLAVFVGVLVWGAVAEAQWSVFKSDRFGFAMLVGPGTKWVARDFGNGWGGIFARSGSVKFAGFARLGYQAPPNELEQFAVVASEVPANRWTLVDKGNNKNGWVGWRTYEARHPSNGRMAFCVVGIGPRGSYVLFLKTNITDYTINKAQYQQWYQSLTVY